MRIGVDCHVLSGMFQGSRTYLFNLYRSILKQKSNHEFFFFGHWSNGFEPFGSNVQYVEYPTHSRWRRLTYETYLLIKKYSLDAFHSNYISPLLLPCKSILTIHDVLFESHPQYFTKSFVYRSKVFVRLSSQKAAQIHTVSEYSQLSIAKYYDIAPTQTYVVPNGVDQSKFHPCDKESAINTIRKHFGLEKYILTVGRLEPRKNHLNLIKAYLKLKTMGNFNYPLVIIGQRDFKYRQVFDFIKQNNLSKDVFVFEEIGNSFLSLFYRAAQIFVYPSFAEGFGIPILESLSCGIPTIASNYSSMPEVIGQAGIVVDPHEISQITSAMHKILTESPFAKQLSMAGPIQAEKFTWDISAQKFINAIDTIEL